MGAPLSSFGRFIALMVAVLAVTPGCSGDAAKEATFDEAVAGTAESASALVTGLTREVVAGDVAHYTIDLQVGSTPNAHLKIHRIVREKLPWLPRHTKQASLLMHGDFATFTTNFALGLVSDATPPEHGLAVYLATRGIDVWGFDRRWTNAPIDATDFSDFATMGFAEEIGDIGSALAFARAVRILSGSGAARLTLVGFSHGAQLAYEYVGQETQKPPGQRHVKNLVPIDIYGRLAPEDEDLRQIICDRIADQQGAYDQGFYDSDNLFFRELGTLANEAPLDPSPFFEDRTNEQAVLIFAGRTHLFFEATHNYHLNGVFIDGGPPTGFRFTPQAVVNDWFANAPPHQSFIESIDGDRLWCGDPPLPLADHYADIQVPIFYLGAAGGFGDHGVYTTTLVASNDVTTHVIRLLDVATEAQDYGHGDLLYGDDAQPLAWEPLADWMLVH